MKGQVTWKSCLGILLETKSLPVFQLILEARPVELEAGSLTVQ